MTHYLSKDAVHDILENPGLLYVDGIFQEKKESRTDSYKEIKKIIESSNTPKTEQMTLLEDCLSPMGKKILDAVSPDTRKIFIKQLLRDNFTIDSLKETDDLYINFENYDIAFFLELWVCYQMRCKCGGRFIKYSSLNQPIVDIRCGNLAHSDIYGPKYFQIKTTHGGTVKGYKYFSQDHIFVGSKKTGYHAHMIKPSENLDNLIGYICISYDKIDDNSIRIVKDKSFMVIPIMDKTQIAIKDIDKFYYNYRDDLLRNKNAIQFSHELNNVEFFDSNYMINLNVTFNTKYINLMDRSTVKTLFTGEAEPFVDAEFLTEISNIKNEITVMDMLNEYAKKNIKRLQCPECKIYEINTVMIPCGHILCKICADKSSKCPICDKPIVNKHNVYFMKYMKYKTKYMKLKNNTDE